jgi:large subunit ribosomal protein L16
MKGNSGRGHELSNGMFGIKSVHEDGMFLTSRQIEAARIAATRFMKERDNYGSKYFQTNQLLRSLLRYVWVKVKVQLSIGLPLLNPEELFEVGGVPLSVAKGVTSCGSKASS